MRNKLYIIIVLIISLLLVGCHYEHTDKTSNELPQNVETNNTNSQSSNENNANSDVGSQHDQFLFLSALETYVVSDTVSETLLNAYQSADEIKSIPVLGTYLEETNLVCYLLYSKGVLCSTATLEFNRGDNLENIDLVEFAESDLSKYPYVDAYSNEACYSAISSCLSIDEDFEVLGVVCSNAGYPATIPIGRCKGETVIKYFVGYAQNFNLVEPFDTIEEGRTLFAKYFLEKEAILSEIPVYEWENEIFYESGYWNMYHLNFVYTDDAKYSEMLIPVMDDVDAWIAIPLLDREMNEDVYISHLLYNKNTLIGEVVLRLSKIDGGKINVKAEYLCVAEKNTDGIYIEIQNSNYQSSIEAAKAAYPDIDISGVIFENGTYIPFGYQSDEIVLMGK